VRDLGSAGAHWVFLQMVIFVFGIFKILLQFLPHHTYYYFYHYHHIYVCVYNIYTHTYIAICTADSLCCGINTSLYWDVWGYVSSKNKISLGLFVFSFWRSLIAFDRDGYSCGIIFELWSAERYNFSYGSCECVLFPNVLVTNSTL
jgi:hypothetical protein